MIDHNSCNTDLEESVGSQQAHVTVGERSLTLQDMIAAVPQWDKGLRWLHERNATATNDSGRVGSAAVVGNAGNGNCHLHASLHAQGLCALDCSTPASDAVHLAREHLVNCAVEMLTSGKQQTLALFKAAPPMEQSLTDAELAKAQLRASFLDLEVGHGGAAGAASRAVRLARRATEKSSWLRRAVGAAEAFSADKKWLPASWFAFLADAACAVVSVWRPVAGGGRRRFRLASYAEDDGAEAIFAPRAGKPSRCIDILFHGPKGVLNHFELLHLPVVGAIRANLALKRQQQLPDAPSGSPSGAVTEGKCALCGVSAPQAAGADHGVALGTWWATHQRTAHAGDLETFLGRHAGRPWLESLWSCVPCGSCFMKRGKAQHCSTRTHSDNVAGLTTPAVRQPPAARSNLKERPPQATLKPVTTVAAPATEYEWDLKAGTPIRAALDAISDSDCIAHGCRLSQQITKQHTSAFCKALNFTLAGMRASSTVAFAEPGLGEATASRLDAAAREQQAECSAWFKVWQLLPALLLVCDGRFSRGHRFALFACGDLKPLIEGLQAYARKVAQRAHQTEVMASLQERASRMARSTGGLSKAARVLRDGPNALSPRDQTTLESLRGKHPAGDEPLEFFAAQEAALQVVEAARAAARAGDVASATTTERHAFTADMVREGIMTSDAGAAAGLSGLGILHLQQMLRYAGGLKVELLEGLAWLGTAAYAEHDALPPAFWFFHTAARLSALGDQARPVACGDTLRRLFGRLFCRKHALRFSTLLTADGQLGVACPGGVERLATMARLVYESGGAVLAIDCRNAFNSLSRSAIMAGVAAHAPDVFAYTTRVYGVGSSPSLLFKMDGVAQPAVIESAQGVQQGDPLGPLLFSLALLPVMREFRSQFPRLALPGYLDDLMLMALGEQSLQADLLDMREAFEWLKRRLSALGLQVNEDKTELLLPPTSVQKRRAMPGDAHDMGAHARLSLGLRVTECLGDTGSSDALLRVTGVPVGDPTLVRAAARRALRSRETDALAREIVLSTDTQLAYTLLRLCLIPRAAFLARNLGPADVGLELQRFDAISMAALAAVMQETPADACGREVADCAGSATSVTCDWHAALMAVRERDWSGEAPVALTKLAQAQATLPLASGGLGIQPLSSYNAAAFLARTAGTLGPALRAMPESMLDRIAALLSGLPLLKELRAAYKDLISRGVDKSGGPAVALLPVGWNSMLKAGDCSVFLGAVRSQDVAAPTSGGVSAPLPQAGVGASLEVTAVSSSPVLVEGAASGAAAAKAAGKPHGTTLSCTPAVARLQHVLCKRLDAQRMDRLMAAARALPVDARWGHMARILSQQGKGAMACFSALPSNSRHFTMRDRCMRETLRRSLGLLRDQIPGGACRCGAAQSGAHAQSCSRDGEQNYRHNKLNSAMREWAVTDLDISVSKESAEAFRMVAYAAALQRSQARGSKGPRLDFVMSPGALLMPLPRNRHGELITSAHPEREAGKGGAVDVAITDPTGISKQRAAALHKGRAGADKTKEKFKTYRDSGLLDDDHYTLFPCIAEQPGSLCPHFHDLIKAFARHQSARSSGVWSESRCVQRWRQRISIVLQNAISDSVARSWTRTSAVPGQPNPDITAYTRVRLLLREPPRLGLPLAAGVSAVEPDLDMASESGSDIESNLSVTSGTSVRDMRGQGSPQAHGGQERRGGGGDMICLPRLLAATP